MTARTVGAALGVASLLVALSSAPASALRDWTEPGALSGPSERARGDLAFTDRAELVAAWSERVDGAAAPVTRAAVATRGTDFSTPATLSVDGGDPVLAVDRQGSAMAAWVGASGSVYVSERKAGAPFGRAETIGVGSGPAQVALNASGAAVVTFVRPGAGGSASIWASVRPAGGVFGLPERVSPDIPGDFRAEARDFTITPDGEVLVVWEEPTAGGTRRVRGSLRQTQGAFGPATTLSDSSREGLDPQIDTDDGPHTAIAWTEALPGRETGRIRWVVRVPGSYLAGPDEGFEEQIRYSRLEEQEELLSQPDLAMADSGQLRLVYVEGRPPGEPPAGSLLTRRGVRLVKAWMQTKPSGERTMEVWDGQLLSTCAYARGTETGPLVAVDASGAAAAAWSSAEPYLGTTYQDGPFTGTTQGASIGLYGERVGAPALTRSREGDTAALWIDESTQRVRVARDRPVTGLTCGPRPYVLPSVVGGLSEGEVLSADAGRWNGKGGVRFRYQWTRCRTGEMDCADIPGPSVNSRRLTSSDVGHRLRVRVTAQDQHGSRTESSPLTAPIRGSRTGGSIVPNRLRGPRRGARHRLRGRSFAVRFRCAAVAGGGCQGRVRPTITARLRKGRKRFALQTRTLRLKPGRSVRLRFTVPRRRIPLLRRARGANVLLTTVLRQSSGRSSKQRFVLRLSLRR